MLFYRFKFGMVGGNKLSGKLFCCSCAYGIGKGYFVSTFKTVRLVADSRRNYRNNVKRCQTHFCHNFRNFNRAFVPVIIVKNFNQVNYAHIKGNVAGYRLVEKIVNIIMPFFFVEKRYQCTGIKNIDHVLPEWRKPVKRFFKLFVRELRFPKTLKGHFRVLTDSLEWIHPCLPRLPVRFTERRKFQFQYSLACGDLGGNIKGEPVIHRNFYSLFHQHDLKVPQIKRKMKGVYARGEKVLRFYVFQGINEMPPFVRRPERSVSGHTETAPHVKSASRHCEARSAEAIHAGGARTVDCHAPTALAMTIPPVIARREAPKQSIRAAHGQWIATRLRRSQ